MCFNSVWLCCIGLEKSLAARLKRDSSLAERLKTFFLKPRALGGLCVFLIEMDALEHHLKSWQGNKAEVCGGRVVIVTAQKAPIKGIFWLGSLSRFLLVALFAQILSNHQLLFQVEIPRLGLAFSRYQNAAFAAGGNTLQQIVSVASTGFGGKVLNHAIS